MINATLEGYLKNKYLNLLLIMLSLVIFFPFIEKFLNADAPIVSFIFLLGLIMTIWALSLPKKVFYIFVTVSVFIFLLELALKILPLGPMNVDIAFITWSIYSLFLLACIVVMIQRLFKSDRVTVDSIVGGINIYFLMAFLWTILYTIVNSFDPHAFNIGGKIDFIRLLYFSYNTLTTLGNGDIVPVNRFTMILSSLEAVAGQLYLAIFVATLVGLHVSKRTS